MNCYVAYMIVGPGEADRWLEPALKQLAWCDEIAVCLNNADPKTEAVVMRYATMTHKDDREWGTNQWRIKQDFLAKVVPLTTPPTGQLWFIGLDADEILDTRFDRAMADKMASGNDIAWYFWCLQLYNDDRTVRPDLCFANVRFWRYMPELGLDFQPTPLHCGLAPRYSYRFGSQSGLWFRHYGLMLPADRARKVARYDRYDPKAKFKGKTWYDALRNEKARTVPLDDMINKLPDFIYRGTAPKLNMRNRLDKVFFFRNKHGKVVEAVGDAQRDQFRKMGYAELQNMKVPATGGEAPVVPTAPADAAQEIGQVLAEAPVVPQAETPKPKRKPRAKKAAAPVA